MKRLKAFFLLTLVFLSAALCGCANVSRLEEQAIISAIGIDKGEKARFRVTVSVFQSMGAGSANPIDPSKPNTVTAHAEADSVNDAMNELRLILGRQVNTGHTKYIILGSEIIDSPLDDALRYFIANEQTYLGTPILTTDKKASDVLKVQLLNDVETAIAVENIIDTAIENGSAVKADLLMAANSLTDGNSLALPVITVKKPPEKQDSASSEQSQQAGSEAAEEPRILLEGTLVSDMKGNSFKLTKEETLGLCFLTKSLDSYEFSQEQNGAKYSVQVDILSCTQNLHVKNSQPELCFTVDCMARILETSELSPDYGAVTKTAQERIEKVCRQVVSRLREHSYGDILRVRKQALSQFPFLKTSYDNIFTDSTLVVNVNVHSDR